MTVLGTQVHSRGAQHPQPPAKPSSCLPGSGPSLTVLGCGKPLARLCEVIQARFVAMLECTNQELF